MKRCLYVLLVFVLMFCFNTTVNASFLRKNSIKTCPNGIKYGYYVSNGVKHWHVAQSCDSSSGWCNDGDELSGDPCPQSSVVNTTTTQVVTTRTTTSRPTTTTTTTTTSTTELTTTTESKETTTINKTEKKEESKEDSKENDKSNSDSSLADSILGLLGLGVFGGGGFYLFRKIKKIF